MTDEKLEVRYLPTTKLEWAIIRKTLRLQGLEHRLSWDELEVKL